MELAEGGLDRGVLEAARVALYAQIRETGRSKWVPEEMRG